MSYRRILVPVDGSRTSSAGLAHALRIAKTHRAKVRLLHVLTDIEKLVAVNTYDGHSGAGGVAEVLKRNGKRILQAAARRATASGIDAQTALIDGGGRRAAELIASDARRWRADLIVMGTHGRSGVNRMLLGSNADLVTRLASVPVLLVQPGASRRSSA